MEKNLDSEHIINKLFLGIIFSAILYYKYGTTIVDDYIYDKIFKILVKHWNKVTHSHKYIINKHIRDNINGNICTSLYDLDFESVALQRAISICDRHINGDLDFDMINYAYLMEQVATLYKDVA